MTVNWKDSATGLIFVAIGAWFIYAGWDLDRGTASRMGPGFFPPFLATILILLGVLIAIRGVGVRPEPTAPVSWRAIFFTLMAPLAFGATVQHAGLIPSLMLATVCSALASRRMTLVHALAIAGGLVVFSVVVFTYGVGIPTPLFGSWFGG